MISAEEEAATSIQTVQMAGSVIGSAALTAELRGKLLHDLGEEMSFARMLRNLDWDGVRKLRRSSSTLAIESIYDALESAGMVGPSSENLQPE